MGIIQVPSFWSNALAIPKHNVCTHENKHQIPVMRDGLQGMSYLEELDCLGTVLLVKAGGGGGAREFSMVMVLWLMVWWKQRDGKIQV